MMKMLVLVCNHILNWRNMDRSGREVADFILGNHVLPQATRHISFEHFP